MKRRLRSQQKSTAFMARHRHSWGNKKEKY